MILQAAQNLSDASGSYCSTIASRDSTHSALSSLQHFLQFDELRAVTRHDLLSHT